MTATSSTYKKVYWYDIQSNVNVVPTKPYNKYLAPSWTIGEVKDDGDTVIVIYGGNEDGDKCFDAIPKSIITKIENIGGQNGRKIDDNTVSLR